MDPYHPSNAPQNPYQPAQPAPQPPMPQHPAAPGTTGHYDPSPLGEQPVAYDQYGNPLYAHPPQQPQLVHISRAIQPEEQNIPADIMAQYEESIRKYPNLNLSKGEFVISSVKRHPIGLLKIWGIALLLLLAFMGLLLGFFMNQSNSANSLLGDTTILTSFGVAIMVGLSLMTILGAFIATYVYNSNHFYLTNESVIQEIQTSLFSKHEQTVSLANIEDASYKQGGIIQTLLNYGTIRLSTEGDETTYRFTYVANPKQHIATLNNAVESFKNGRPIHGDD